MVREWSDAILFAVVAATIIRTFVIEAYKIPTTSLEGSLLEGDFLFVSKLNYGARTPITPIAIPFFHHSISENKNNMITFAGKFFWGSTALAAATAWA